MARKVFLHVGLPKTGTTYLQTVMWGNRDRLRAEGVLLPGTTRSDHWWSSLIVREDKRIHNKAASALNAWDRVLADCARWDRTAVVSHEFFSSASAEQAKRAVAALAPAEVHVVVTAREPLSLLTASWQEALKFKGTVALADYNLRMSDNPRSIWNWRALDAGEVLSRWGPAVPKERVHVMPLPKPGSPPELLWQRFAGLIGVDPDGYDLSHSNPNTSMGVVEAEVLRRVTPHLTEIKSGLDRSTWVRTYLAAERLVPRGGEKFWPNEGRIAECRERGRAMVAMIRENGFDVIGELETLLVPDDLPPRRTPESVTDAEVAAVATELVAVLLQDLRRQSRQRPAKVRGGKAAVAPAGSGFSWARRTVRRSALLTRVYRKVRRISR